jgi:hypothetical protein
MAGCLICASECRTDYQQYEDGLIAMLVLTRVPRAKARIDTQTPIKVRLHSEKFCNSKAVHVDMRSQLSNITIPSHRLHDAALSISAQRMGLLSIHLFSYALTSTS